MPPETPAATPTSRRAGPKRRLGENWSIKRPPPAAKRKITPHSHNAPFDNRRPPVPLPNPAAPS